MSPQFYVGVTLAFGSRTNKSRSGCSLSRFKSRSHLYHKTLRFINENCLIDEYYLEIATIMKKVMEAPPSKDKNSVAITQF
jgi:hypothetical protein